MKTIQAVELRKNLDEVIKAAMLGETIKVSYRNKPAIKIIRDEDARPVSNVPALLKAAEKIRSKMDPETLKRLQNMTDSEMKAEYNRHREEKYGK